MERLCLRSVGCVERKGVHVRVESKQGKYADIVGAEHRQQDACRDSDKKQHESYKER